MYGTWVEEMSADKKEALLADKKRRQNTAMEIIVSRFC
jgi:hypothetical protein